MLPPPTQTPLTRNERWAYGLFLLALLGLFAGEVVADYRPVKLAALFVVLFRVPLLAMHEAGHAVAAAVLGWRVRRVVIGMGRVVARWRVGPTPVELRLFPVEGFVVPVPTRLRAPRLENALIYFAGPGAELAVVVLVAATLGVGRLLGDGDDAIDAIALRSLALAAAAGAVLNLFPHVGFTADGPVASDGLGILRSFWLPDAAFAAQVVEPPTLEDGQHRRDEGDGGRDPGATPPWEEGPGPR